MINQMYTVYDSKVEAYLPPFFVRSRGEAIRNFETAVNQVDHQFCKFSADYTLFYIGDYDDEDAKFKLPLAPESVGNALEFKKEATNA